jgi:isopentenyl-diphosphate delta-isomerase
MENCQLDTQIGGLKFGSPIFINAMTGGSISTIEINRDLAAAAKTTGVALAVGSQRAALSNPQLTETYRIVRTVNPEGVIIGNLGADTTVEDAKRAVEMVEANMLQLHLNVPQELVMPEGDRDFRGILRSIEQVVRHLAVPVIVKEVGFGMSSETYRQLMEIGVSQIDVGGRGGTNFIRIENQRRTSDDYPFLYGWGQSTVVSLLELQLIKHPFDVIASGGIRNALDMVKTMILGAKAVGVAGPILRLHAEAGAEGVIQAIDTWHEHLKIIMTMLGVRTIRELSSVPLVITGKSKDWCLARGIDIHRYAKPLHSL